MPPRCSNPQRCHGYRHAESSMQLGWKPIHLNAEGRDPSPGLIPETSRHQDVT